MGGNSSSAVEGTTREWKLKTSWVWILTGAGLFPFLSLSSVSLFRSLIEMQHWYSIHIRCWDVQLGTNQAYCASLLRASNTHYVTQNGRFCYEYVNRSVSWAVARNDCMNRKGNLVEITSDAINAFIYNFIGTIRIPMTNLDQIFQLKSYLITI